MAFGGFDKVWNYNADFEGSTPDIIMGAICFTLVVTLNLAPMIINIYYIRSN